MRAWLRCLVYNMQPRCAYLTPPGPFATLRHEFPDVLTLGLASRVPAATRWYWRWFTRTAEEARAL